MRSGLLAATVLATGVAAILAGCGKDAPTDTPAESSTDMLFRFERFTAFTPVDGPEVTLQSLRGKVVLFDLFGTWCPPCRKSAPLIVSLYERYSAKGFEVVGLAYEQGGDPQAAREAVEGFRKEFNIPYTLGLGPEVVWEDLREKTPARGAVPTLVVMDRQGVVRDLFEGLPPGHEAVLADRIERLLAEPDVPLP